MRHTTSSNGGDALDLERWTLIGADKSTDQSPGLCFAA
jgi:hypothetical protein